MIDQITIRSGATIPLPAFFPDATYGAIRAAGFEDVAHAGLMGVEMNTYHLVTKPGAKSIKSMGGLHTFTGYPGAILTDSGGFQLYSMIRENAAYGEIRPNEILFRPDLNSGEKLRFTPEKCIQSQFMLGSDIMMALDLCTHPDDPFPVQRQSVEYTVKWGKSCKATFDGLVASSKTPVRPLLFGIVQGGADRALRLDCGARLAALGFDGFGFGGWPTDKDGHLRDDVLMMAAEAMPDDRIKYAMGVGKPEEIVRCVAMGYRLFDCVIPTREARHRRLFVFEPGMDTPEGVRVADGSFYHYMYILDDTYVRDPRPIDESCDCVCCRHYSRAYLKHLFHMSDPQAYRLATAHNLRFYGRLMEALRHEIH